MTERNGSIRHEQHGTILLVFIEIESKHYLLKLVRTATHFDICARFSYQLEHCPVDHVVTYWSGSRGQMDAVRTGLALKETTPAIGQQSHRLSFDPVENIAAL